MLSTTTHWRHKAKEITIGIICYFFVASSALKTPQDASGGCNDKSATSLTRPILLSDFDPKVGSFDLVEAVEVEPFITWA